jgi:hypothetical protein
MKNKVMQRSLYLSYFILLLSFFSYGQNTNPVFYCGYDEVIKFNELQFPGYASNVKEAFRQAKDLAKSAVRNTDILKVNVVVHMVHKENSENLHDSIIQNQMVVLNQAFRLQNENRDDIRDIFKDLQTDAQIEFELQEVIRVKTNANFALTLTGLPDAVKQKSKGGSDAISPEKVLNIWVCKIQPIPFIGGQILGYAYPPAGLANWPDGASAPSLELDGVVIDFRVFGANNPNKLTVNGQSYDAKGRTTVHEVGHYLGLRHIWGDGGGIFGGSSCGEDDGIEDTPNQGAQSPGGCNKMANTCIDAQNDLPDMVENYMDYSGENCQNTFTEDQVSVMRSVLLNQRSTLVSSLQQSNIESLWTIFPNPAKDRLDIRFNEISAGTVIQLSNMTGTIIKKIDVSGTVTSVDVSDLPSGLYCISCQTLGKKLIQKVIIHE